MTTRRKPDPRALLDGAAALSMIIAAVGIVWLIIWLPNALQTRAATERPPSPGQPPAVGQVISLTHVALQGDSQARVGVIEFGDFECRFCRQFSADTLPAVVAELVDTGRIFMGYWHMPLEAIHKAAVGAAELAECGRRQGQFWPVHDALLERPDLSGVDFMHVGIALGLEREALARCLDGEATPRVRQDADEARALGIRGTPTFLFGVRDSEGQFRVLHQASGALSFERFSKILDQTIQAAEVE